jgi:hypothetical protein
LRDFLGLALALGLTLVLVLGLLLAGGLALGFSFAFAFGLGLDFGLALGLTLGFTFGLVATLGFVFWTLVLRLVLDGPTRGFPLAVIPRTLVDRGFFFSGSSGVPFVFGFNFFRTDNFGFDIRRPRQHSRNLLETGYSLNSPTIGHPVVFGYRVD